MGVVQQVRFMVWDHETVGSNPAAHTYLYMGTSEPVRFKALYNKTVVSNTAAHIYLYSPVDKRSSHLPLTQESPVRIRSGLLFYLWA